MIGYSVKAEIPLCRRHLWWKGRWQKQRQQIGSKMEFEHYIQQGQQKLRWLHHRNVCGAGGKGCRPDAAWRTKNRRNFRPDAEGALGHDGGGRNSKRRRLGQLWRAQGRRRRYRCHRAVSDLCQSKKTAGTKIVIDGGIGVGRVTKPGLEQPVGAAAINSVPRRMILQEAEAGRLDRRL